MIKALINGEPATTVSIKDRAFNYGDGVFETIAVKNKQLQFWSSHFLRLKKGCQKLGIDQPDEKQLLSDIKQLITESDQFVLKILISRGTGGRGYAVDGVLSATIVLSLNPWPVDIETKQTHGINTRLCQHRLAINPALAGIKHLNRIDQVIARNEWHNTDITEGIMLDYEDYLIEGTATNLFVKINGQWQTAPEKNCAVAGTIRAFVLAHAGKKNLAICERKVHHSELSSVEEMFVCNSIWGIVPVVSCDQLQLTAGDDTRHLQKELEQHLVSYSYDI